MSSIIKQRKRGERGFTLMEMVFYVSIMVLIVGLSVSAIFSFTSAYRRFQSAWFIESAATTALERMSRETRDALSLDLFNSVLNASPGQLQLNTTNDAGATTTVQFFLTNQVLHVKEAGVDTGPLSPTKARITTLIFRQIVATSSQAVKIEMTIESGTSTNYQTKNFYSTVVMRGSYPP